MLSNSTKYGIKAVLYLALNSDENKKILAKDLSTSINAPKAYLAKILQDLSRNQIVSSTKGPNGGFFLSHEDKQQPLINVIKTINGPHNITTCTLSLKTCNSDRPCVLHKLTHPSKSKLLEGLEDKTIEEITLDILAGESYLPA